MWNGDLVFGSLHDRIVLLAEQVLRKIEPFLAHPENKSEAGGILIGSYRGLHIDVADCTSPMALDRRSALMFDRSDPGHQEAALLSWRQSEATETFVGEWHTHPEDYPIPSGLDHRTWRKLLARSDYPLVFFIGGRKETWCGLGFKGHVQKLAALS